MDPTENTPQGDPGDATPLFALATAIIDIAEDLRAFRTSETVLTAVDLEQVEVGLRRAVEASGADLGDDFARRVERARLGLLRKRLQGNYRRIQEQIRRLNAEIAELDALLGEGDDT